MKGVDSSSEVSFKDTLVLFFFFTFCSTEAKYFKRVALKLSGPYPVAGRTRVTALRCG